jgi:cytoskeletal protein CcmA (bactofilin family)
VREERRVAAWIGASIVIEGNLTSSEDLTIAGRVEGDVVVREHTVTIAPNGRIDGNIDALTVAVHGQVTGVIAAGGKLEIGETGTVDGDIRTPRLVVAEGAVLKGRVGVAMAPAAG